MIPNINNKHKVPIPILMSDVFDGSLLLSKDIRTTKKKKRFLL